MDTTPSGSNYHFGYSRQIYGGNYDYNDLQTEFTAPAERKLNFCATQ